MGHKEDSGETSFLLKDAGNTFINCCNADGFHGGGACLRQTETLGEKWALSLQRILHQGLRVGK